MKFVDQINREINLDKSPCRIVSLVPSQTELLIDLGLEEKLVGITKFCIHPKEIVKSITKIGGTKNFNLERIRSLNPDLIIANKEENEETKLKELMSEYPVWISDIKDLGDALNMIEQIGTITDKGEIANKLSKTISEKFKQFASTSKTKKRVLYLIWKNPYMSVNKDTFIHDMISKCGWENACPNTKKRYPEISIEEIAKLKPDNILLSSEPFPFKEKHIAELKKIIPNATISIVDGEAFSWYGSKLIASSDYFAKLLNEQQ
jgi:ABC-type Fe3+-hydroxamate transport system substrate-binding protein